jgi:hypothetical protein
MDPKVTPGSDEELLKPAAGAESQDELEVDLDETPAKPAGDQTLDLDQVEDDEKEFKRLDPKAFAAMRREKDEYKRKAAELEKKYKEFSSRPVQAAPQYTPAPTQPRESINGVPVPQTKEEWDNLARQDWQLAVDMRSIINSRRITAEAKSAQEGLKTLEDAKQKVLDKYPDLGDVSSEKSQIYLRILDRHPEYLTLPKGPIYAMRDMEDEMESLGMLSDKKSSKTQTEAVRTSRAALTAPGKFVEKAGRTVTLTKDELEFCEGQGLDPKEFAKKKHEQEMLKKGAQL